MTQCLNHKTLPGSNYSPQCHRQAVEGDKYCRVCRAAKDRGERIRKANDEARKVRDETRDRKHRERMAARERATAITGAVDKCGCSHCRWLKQEAATP